MRNEAIGAPRAAIAGAALVVAAGLIAGGCSGSGAGAAIASTQRNMVIAYKLGATGKLPETVGL